MFGKQIEIWYQALSTSLDSITTEHTQKKGMVLHSSERSAKQIRVMIITPLLLSAFICVRV